MKNHLLRALPARLCYFLFSSWLCFLPYLLHAQTQDLSSLASWVALDAPTGHEHLSTDRLLTEFPGWYKDRYGNLIKTVGSGTPHRVVACGLDSYAYAISQITNDGYLRLHRIGAGSSHPLWDQSHQGQHLRILTTDGPLIGVTAVANGHFAAQHRHETSIITQNDLWLDVGAQSAADVAAMGIDLLDPVIRDIPAWSFANEVAGPRSSARIACAATMAAAQSDLNGETGSTSYVISVQQVFGWIGLGAALVNLPIADELIVLSAGEALTRREVVENLGTRVDAVLASRVMGEIHLLSAATANGDSLMESVTLTEANNLLQSLVTHINPANSELPNWLAAPSAERALNNEVNRWGSSQNLQSLMAVERLLDQLAEKSAVPGHEGPIRDFIFNQLPQWAKQIAQTDAMGNLWLEFGAQGPANIFIAHMDEVGYEVASVNEDGSVNLNRLGGAVATAWEGQPALLQLDTGSDIDSMTNPPQLRGVFLTRADADSRQPGSIQAWFGMDARQLEQAGVRTGMGLTGYKEGHRMGAYRYAARSLDDRVGSTALLKAVQEMDPTQMSSRVIIAWSVREEGGLRGAAALAERLWEKVRRVYSVDTFVSSDTPLESPHFAYAPLGSGPVLRSVENASMAVPVELKRNKSIADAAGIDVQIGLTQGGTDGTTFTIYGVPNAGVSWPGRYSHSPAEIADLRDVLKLVELIKALAAVPADAP